MPRPCKRRRICALPRSIRFVPESAEGDAPAVRMTLDEYEAIRLIDFAGLTQEQCAAQMGVARATVQAIYTQARAKLARCLVLSQPLDIDGGDVVLCDVQHRQEPHRICAACPGRSRTGNGRKTIMKIAATYENGQIFQHFGHCAQFKLYEIEDGKVVSSEVIDAAGSGHGLLAGMLMMHGVDALICGGIGGGAQNALRGFGIRIHAGVQGGCDEAVEALMAGTLVSSESATCGHHDHHHGADHVCGDHGCGEGHCGGNCHD